MIRFREELIRGSRERVAVTRDGQHRITAAWDRYDKSWSVSLMDRCEDDTAWWGPSYRHVGTVRKVEGRRAYGVELDGAWLADYRKRDAAIYALAFAALHRGKGAPS